ncbi:class I SAM-dependent methyltransferase [Dysgonomonas macrotermitis]|uniref:tRNA (Cmo5U34)-methyltransferase n=1 Tax=Dysgonomonas macrotermitis TaxID=1346286 RepID=A0A1M5B024_9BACT|nr:class I SAM-dependent methyltransferase [Dysgonomonas macrotermitis]SHF35800.1 tRNA (cmo5U34)-methyltransferase [Dysgonomonas macrotermitis]
MNNKLSTKEIQERFDKDVERFSNLETGQVSTIDATISLELITESAKRICPKATDLLDIGCGAGNYTLKMLSKVHGLNCTLIDLSLPMLNRAEERVTSITNGNVTCLQGDIREIDLENGRYDIILAGAVLHHLRDDNDWETVFSKLYRILKKGGCLMISDLITQNSPLIDQYFTEKYTEYLTNVGGAEYAQNVLAYIEKEDTPRPLNFQLDLMKKVGFSEIEILHKNICFAAYGGIK